MGLGRILVEKGDLKSALLLFSVVATEGANVRLRAEASYSAGEVSLELGDVENAKRLINDATTLDPKYALGWCSRLTWRWFGTVYQRQH